MRPAITALAAGALCPGPALTNLATGASTALVFVAAMVLGMAIHRRVDTSSR